MIVGLPTEILDHEFRVGLTPGGVETLVRRGHEVLVQRGAGLGSGFDDSEYEQAGGTLVDTQAEAYAADLVVKVKEPQPSEFGLMRPGLILFTYLHLAANQPLVDKLLEQKVTAIAYETVQTDSGSLPLLKPMSEIAGKMVVQIGAHYLEKTQGGRGILLGGVPGVLPGAVVILGGGTVGTSAAQVALGLGARVTVIDIDLERLRYLDHILAGRLNTIASHHRNIVEAVRRAEVLIGAVLIPGGRAPVLVDEDLIASMAPGSVVLDIAVDQGGCIATIRQTTHSEPTYVHHGVVHYGVPNVPGAVPRTSTYALTNATLPYIVRLAEGGFEGAVAKDQALARGVNTLDGHITHQAVAEAFGRTSRPLTQIIAQ